MALPFQHSEIAVYLATMTLLINKQDLFKQLELPTRILSVSASEPIVTSVGGKYDDRKVFQWLNTVIGNV